MRLPLILACLLAGLFTSAWASGRQDPLAIQTAVESFLRKQTAGQPGQIDVSVSAVDARLNLPPCAALQPALAPGSRPWGKTTVVVRCAAPSPWTVYVSATVKVVGEYLVSAKPLAQGQPITAADLTAQHGDLTQLPPGIVTDPAQAVGRTPVSGIPSGSPLRQDMLRPVPVVVQNQSVQLVSEGRGFKVSADATALASAAEGQVVQARTRSGQVVSGIARAGTVVEVAY